jgi:phage shock protein A
MNIFKRLFKIGEAEAHSAIDQLEDPIKMTEQGIRDMKEDLDRCLHGLAQVKALAIRAKSDVEMYKEKAEDYEKKAVILLTRAQQGDIDKMEADRLASEAIIKKNENINHATRSLEDQKKYEASVSQMEHNIKTLRIQISKYENELKTLQARVKVSNATKNINKQLAQLDNSGTVAMLERMKEKVAQNEALAESYGTIANESKSIDEEIDKAIEKTTVARAGEELAALKEKLGIPKE